ncbi:MAG: PorP/SprF family type IX secretion system membrane protein [Bacteroidales bacterium]|jgi:type IX secretion system PorP/SprF family membrane protein|nr:PorP/SprF family type IX secretion system membrane protein [Bacteroidales bacterium]
MMSKKIYFLMILGALTSVAFGQQEPQFSQYMYTILPFNPGYAGSGGICAAATYRQQWAGFVETNEDGEKTKVNPREALFSIHAPIKALHGGLGLSVYNDALGHQNDIGIKVAYSFRMNISGGTLGIGLSVDFLNRGIKTDEFTPGQSADPNIIANLGKSSMYIDASLGAFYQMPDKWFAGIAATQLISAIGGDEIGQKGARHLYAMGGYTFTLPANPNWTLTPQAFVKADFKVPTFDLTLIADWNKLVWFGASYRFYDAVVLLVGAKPFANYSSAIRGLEVALSYDVNTSQMFGTHGNGVRSYGGPEITLKYCFSIITKPSIYGYKGTRLLGNRPIDFRY